MWGTRVSPSTVSDLNKKIYGTIEAWRNRPIEGEHPYAYLDGIVLKRSWAGEVRNVSLLVAIAVNGEGYREILGICEGAKEDKAGWSAFLKHLKGRGLHGVQLIISDACMGLRESAAGRPHDLAVPGEADHGRGDQEIVRAVRCHAEAGRLHRHVGSDRRCQPGCGAASAQSDDDKRRSRRAVYRRIGRPTGQTAAPGSRPALDGQIQQAKPTQDG